ncbi:MAG: hypothetical protein KAW12_11505 [Candidatus Aminicenantes bacterium]|nr:hypothetical protein [Candidatus Aminicenantes bacterium]
MIHETSKKQKPNKVVQAKPVKTGIKDTSLSPPRQSPPVIQHYRNIGNMAAQRMVEPANQKQEPANTKQTNPLQMRVVEKDVGIAAGDEHGGKEAVTYVAASSKNVRNLTSEGYCSCVGLVFHDKKKKWGLVAHFWAPGIGGGDLLPETTKDAAKIRKKWGSDIDGADTKKVFGGLLFNQDTETSRKVTRTRVNALAAIFKTLPESKGHDGVELKVDDGTIIFSPTPEEEKKKRIGLDNGLWV